MLDRSAARQRDGNRVRSTPFAHARRRLAARGPATVPPREAGRREGRPTRARGRTTPSPLKPHTAGQRAQSTEQNAEQSTDGGGHLDRSGPGKRARAPGGRRPRRESRRILTDQKRMQETRSPGRREPAAGRARSRARARQRQSRRQRQRQPARAQRSSRRPKRRPVTWKCGRRGIPAWTAKHGESPWSPAANRPELYAQP